MDNQGMGPETVKIRRAGTEDLPGIMRLQLQSYGASLQEPASLFERIIGASPDTCLAAEYEGVMAAYLLAHPIPDDFKGFGKGPPPLSGSETAFTCTTCALAPRTGTRASAACCSMR